MAILLVVTYHTLYTNPERGVLSQMAGYIIKAGWMGVPIFFVLSGFLISLPFFKGRQANPDFWYQRGYALRRIAKIMPPFYLSLLIGVIGCLWHHDWAGIDAAWKWGTGLANFIPTPESFSPFYWSLIIEVHFYILLPLFFFFTRKLSVSATALLIFFVLLLIPMIARHFTWSPGVLIWPDEHALLRIDWLLNRFPCQLDYFAYGVLFSGIYVGMGPVREKVPALSLFGYAGAALLVLTMLLWGAWTTEFAIDSHPTRWSIEIAHLLPAISSLLLLFFLFDRRALGSRFLSARWLSFIGIVSYEWFLFHGPFVRWFYDHYGDAHGNLFAYLWRVVTPLILSFGFSVLVYRFFSLPIINWVRNYLKTSVASPN